MIGSILLVLLGCAVVGLGMLPSDASRYFLLFGTQLIGSGALGAISAWLRGRGRLRFLLRALSLIVNAALVVWTAVLIFNGMVRGPLLVAAPLLFGVPAVLNILSAAFAIGRAESTSVSLTNHRETGPTNKEHPAEGELPE